jgi:hypothetical protein
MPAESAQPPVESRQRRVLPAILVVVATVIGIVATLGLWAERQALETDTWTETSSELLEQEEIRDAIADFIVAAIYDNVDVQAELENRLPPNLQALAGPAAGGLQQLATDATQEVLTRPKVQVLWEEANRAAHERLLALLEDEGEFVATTGGVVTLDLSGLIDQIASQIGIGADISSKLPPEAGDLQILDSNELEAAQTGVDLLQTLAWVLTVVALALYALAVALARGRRRETLRMVGFGFLALGVLALLLRNAGGNALTSSLAETAASEPAIQATWDIGTSLLQEMGQSLIAYGLVVVLAAWLAGPTATATSVRREIAPYLRQPRIAYGALAVVLVLLFWWDPVVATHRLAPSLLLVVLLAIGVEALRRQVIREFPDRVTTHSAEGAARAIASRMSEAREARVTPKAGTAAPAAEGRLAELERLARLRDAGVLTDEEFQQEKRTILSGS